MVQEVIWVPGQVWTGREYLAFTDFKTRTFKPIARDIERKYIKEVT
jgi:hypothetical protein